MKILLINPWPNDWESQNPTTRKFLEFLIKKKNKVIILQPGPYVFTRLNDFISVYSFGRIFERENKFCYYFNFLLITIKAFLKGKSIIKSQKIDLIIGFGGYSVLASYLLGKLYRIPVVIKLFGVMYATKMGFGIKSLILNLEHYLGYIIPVDLLIVVNDGTGGDVLEKKFKPRRFLFSPQPRPDFKDMVLEKNHLGIPDDAKLLIFVSRLNFFKGVMLLPDIFKRINKVMPNTYLLVIGEGDCKRNLIERMKEYSLLNKCIVLGEIKNEELKPYYEMSDLFLGLNLVSNVSLPTFEALSCGIPVVALNTGYTGDYLNISKGVYLVESLEPEDISREILKVLKDAPLYKELKNNAQEFSKEIPTYDEVFEKEYEVILRVLP